MADPRRPTSGELRQVLTWMTRTSLPVDGSCGQGVDTWTSQGTMRARVVPYDGNQVWNADQLKALRRHRITLHYGPAIGAGDRLMLNGRTLTVDSVWTREEKSLWLEIIAIEQAQGQAGGP